MDVREFVMPFQVPISDIVREGLDTVLRRVLRDFPVLDFFEPSSIRNIQLNNSDWHFHSIDQPIVLEWEFVNRDENM